MKILLVSLNYAPEPTGIAPYSTGLAEFLAAEGHDVHVLSGIPHYPQWRNTTGARRWRSVARSGRITHTRLRHYVPPGGTGAKRLLLELSFALGVAVAPWGEPDVVVSVSPSLFASAAAMVRGRAMKLPSVVWVQDLYSRGVVELNGDEGASARVLSWLESRTLRAASRVVVIHDRFGAFVHTALGVAPENVTEIRNWAHLEATADPQGGERVRSTYGWGQRPIVLHCGNMGAKQGLEAVVAAARQAEEQRRSTLFVLLGDGSQRPMLEAAGAGCGNLQILPPLPGSEFQDALATADVLLLNEAEGVREMALPSKLTTYFAAGKPVLAAVALDGTSADELRAAGAGVVVPPGDATAMLDATDALVADPQRARDLGRAGQRYAESTLSDAGVFRRWQGLLRDVVAGAPSARAASPLPASPAPAGETVPRTH